MDDDGEIIVRKIGSKVVSAFRITITNGSNEDRFIAGRVDKLSSFTENSGAVVAQQSDSYATFSAKFSGCCHIAFSEHDDSDYIHLCGSIEWENHIWLMNELWSFIASEFDNFEDKSQLFVQINE